MSNFISKDGKWYPAKEKVGLVNTSGKTKVVNDKKVLPGEPYIYEGPDRAALFELFKEKVETFGQDFRQDIDLIQRVKQLGYTSVNEYAQVMGYDKEKVEEEFKKKAEVVHKHELPEKVKAIQELGGGRDTAGDHHIFGDFGEPKEIKK